MTRTSATHHRASTGRAGVGPSREFAAIGTHAYQKPLITQFVPAVHHDVAHIVVRTYKALLQLAMDRHRACYFGDGANTLFMVWYKFVHQPSSLQIRFCSHPDHWVYPATNCVGRAVGEVLVRHARLEGATPESISVDEVSNPFPNVWAGTQRLEPTRGRIIGWNPEPVDIKEHLNESIDAMLDKIHQKL
ncbi:hypothetical protein BC827DRAFT_9341 [Russula dissimulans]|nr:hypothetical protein BC827DRAFT_9341 [Russula dissimulans]